MVAHSLSSASCVPARAHLNFWGYQQWHQMESYCILAFASGVCETRNNIITQWSGFEATRMPTESPQIPVSLSRGCPLMELFPGALPVLMRLGVLQPSKLGTWTGRSLPGQPVLDSRTQASARDDEELHEEQELESDSGDGVESCLSSMETTEELCQYFAETKRHGEEAAAG